MPRPRFANLHPERQQAILGAAAEEFAAHGFDEASYNKIIERSGVSKGAMYYYFDDKEDLYYTVLRERVQDKMSLIGITPVVQTPEAFWNATDALVRNLGETWLKDPVTVGLLRSAMKYSHTSPTNPTLKELLRTLRDLWVDFVRVGQKAGALRTDLPLDLMVRIVTALDDAWYNWMDERAADSDELVFVTYPVMIMQTIRRLLEP